MKLLWGPMLLLSLMMAACQPAADEPQELPTLAVLPTLSPTGAQEVVAPQAAATDTPPQPTITSQVTTAAATPTVEVIAVTPSPTRPPVTIEIREEVRFATLTPASDGANAPLRETPVVMADAVITEQDFQRAVDQAVADVDSIQFVRVDFVPDGIAIELTALGGAAFVTGNVHVLVQVAGGFVAISIDDVTVNAAEPSDTYLETVNMDFFDALLRAFDLILTEKVGEDHDLESVLINDEAMQVFLLVPQS